MSDLLPVREAQERILAVFAPLGSEQVHFSIASGRILAEDINAPYDLPLFTNSSMDGFALRAADANGASPETPVLLPVVGDIPAGAVSPPDLMPGQAVRIMTGAPLPQGADAVIPIEDTLPGRILDSGLPVDVQLKSAARPGQYIRPVGQDARAGQVIFPRGHQITSPDIGLLTMFGITQVPVFAVPRVAVLSSGNELIDPHEPLAPGKIRDANTYMLAALVQEFGGQVVYTGIARDEYQAVQERFDEAVHQKPDLLLSSAGVSVGAFDFIRAVLQDQGQLAFWRVNMRPGKPVAFGSYRGTPMIGLPGNPVSAFVGFLVFVRPVLRRLAGMEGRVSETIQARLTEPLESDGRESYLRAVVTHQSGEWLAKMAGNQASSNLLSIVQSNALLIVPSGVKSLPAGSIVEAWMFRA